MRKALVNLAAMMLVAAPAYAQDEAESPNTMPPVDQQIGSGDRLTGASWARTPVFARNGIAATAQPLATQVALDILKAGGSAVDAAIAANAMLGLVEPTGNGIGGDLFAIILDPATGKLVGINGSGRTPSGQTLDELKAKINAAIDGLKVASPGMSLDQFKAAARANLAIPPVGHLPVTIPGTVDAWFEMHRQFGRLPMATVLAPAVRYAREGHPVSPLVALYFAYGLNSFERRLESTDFEFANARATYFVHGAPKTGEMFRNPDLANTLENIGRDGRDAFYRGKLADVMVAYLQRQGSAFTREDFANHRSQWVEPFCVAYRKGYELCELPPNGQGFAALQMVNILKNVDLARWERGSPQVLHYITEAKRLAHADVARFYADPDFARFHEGLLTAEYGAARFALIDPAKANPDFGPGDPAIDGPGDTTYMTVADKDGMMVSLIQSNYRGMGGGLVPDGLGFMFQDRGELFSLDPAHPNAYEPDKRPFHTIIPAFIKKDGVPIISMGLMGGDMQPQGHVQILVNIVDYGMDLQEAGDAARIYHSGGREPTEPLEGATLDPLGTLYVETGIPAASVEALKAMGHKVEYDNGGFGGYQAIARDPETGVYNAATEMRKDGQAAGY